MTNIAATAALAIIALASTTPASAAAGTTGAAQTTQAAQPQIKISAKAGKAILELQTAVNATDIATIPAKAAAAKAVAQTADDRYAIGQLQWKAALAAKDNEAAAAAADYIAASGFIAAPLTAALYNSVGISFYNIKNFDRASALFEKGLAADPNSAESLKLLAEARNSQGRGADAAQLMQRALTVSAAAGPKPSEELYKRAVSLAYNAKQPAAVDLGRQWIGAYPNADSWHNGVAIYRNMMRPDVESTLDLLRLMRAANALQGSGDYTLYASAASEQGNFNEAQAVIDEGIAAKKVDPSASLAADIIKGLKAKPKATAADLEAASKMAKTATATLAVGNRFYGMGNYARAAELYRVAIGAGADANLANLHLGMALVRSGDKAGATSALNAVGGNYAAIAKYWLLFVQQAG